MEKGEKLEVREAGKYGLLESQRKLFYYYRDFWGREGRAPTLRELGEAFGASVASMGQRVRWLKRRGLIRGGGEGGGWAERAGDWGVLAEWLRSGDLYPVTVPARLKDGRAEAGDLLLLERKRLPEPGDLVHWATVNGRPGLWLWPTRDKGILDAYAEGGPGDQPMRPARPSGVAVLRVHRFVEFPGGRQFLTEADVAGDPVEEAVGEERISVDNPEGV